MGIPAKAVSTGSVADVGGAMSTVFRRSRGILGTTLIWSIGWSIVGAGLRGGTRVLQGATPRLAIYLESMAQAAIGFGMAGAVAGILFAFALLAVERRTPFDRVKLSRVTAAGAGAGSAFPLAAWVLLELPMGVPQWDAGRVIPLFAALGAFTAAFTLRVARRAHAVPTLPPESP